MIGNVVLFVMFCVFIYLLDYPEGDNFKIARAPRTRRSSRTVALGLSRGRRRSLVSPPRHHDSRMSASRSLERLSKSVTRRERSRVICPGSTSAPVPVTPPEVTPALRQPTRSLVVASGPPAEEAQPMATRVFPHSPPLLSCVSRQPLPPPPPTPQPPPQSMEASGLPLSTASSKTAPAASAASLQLPRPASASQARLFKRSRSRGSEAARKAAVAATLANAVRCLEEQRADHIRGCSFDETSA